MRLRQWQVSDAAEVPSLLDDHPDPLWRRQFAGLHGPDGAGSGWQRTIVAADEADRMVGCATIAVSSLHPGRFPCAIDVAPQWRRRGVGTALLAAIRQARPHRALLSTKVRVSNTAASAFIAQAGGAVYQRSPAVVVDPHHEEVRSWALRRATSRCTSLVRVESALLEESFAGQYVWVHQTWSPVGDLVELSDIAVEEIGALDRKVSAGAWLGERLAAVAFAFPSAIGFDVVAETVAEREPAGVELVADAVALVLSAAAARGGLVEFDGHVTDPHLYPVLQMIPWYHSDSLDLVEIP